MVKLETLRIGIINGDAKAFIGADRALANPATTKYKRRVLTELLDAHPRPAGAPAPVTVPPVVAPEPVPPALAPTGDAAQAARWIMQAAGVSDAIIEAAIAVLVPVSVTIPVAVDDVVVADEMSDDEIGDLEIEDDPILIAMRREAWAMRQVPVVTNRRRTACRARRSPPRQRSRAGAASPA